MTGEVVCGSQRLTRPELSERTARTVAGLDAWGVGVRDRVALLLRNCVEFLEITAAVGHLGAYPVPINWRLKPGEVGELLDDCAPSAIFVQSDLLDSLPAAWRSRTKLSLVGPGEDGQCPYTAWRDSWAPSQRPPAPAPGAMLYTSGTMGAPKGVERAPPTPEQASALKAVRLRLYRIQPDSRCLVPGPLYHAMPNQFAFYAAQDAAHLSISLKFDAEDFLATVQREHITSVALAPVMLVRLLRLPPEVRARYDVSSLRWVLHAGGPCPADVKRAMIDWWGPVLGEYYGGTETGPLTLCDSAEWLAHPGTCGKPLPEVTLRLVTPDGGDAAPGEPGEIYGRLWPSPDFTYRHDPAKRAACGQGDLVSLGDIGYQDDEGYLYLCDRARDMIVSGGVNIYPAEVEATLISLPGVEDCAVFGVPDAEFGEVAVAIVSGRDLEGEDLRRRLRLAIADYKVPKAIHILPSLSRDASGKLRKRELREEYLAGTVSLAGAGGSG